MSRLVPGLPSRNEHSLFSCVWPGRAWPVCFLLPLICAFFSFSTTSAARETDLLEVTTDKLLIDVVDDAEFAITERNFRVIGRLHIGKGIRERGNPGYPDYEVIMFCSLTYAEQMFDLDPGMVNFCPMKVTIRDTGKEVVIATPLLPENFANERMNKVTAKINRQLREIVEFARKDWLELYEKQQKP